MESDSRKVELPGDPPCRQPSQTALLVGWSFLVVGGLWALTCYSQTAGTPGTVVARWPADAVTARSERGSTLLMFMHPHCACSTASLEQLNRVLARVGTQLAPQVLFVRPTGALAGWERSSLWSAAAAIPGVQVAVDPSGVEAKRFGATTSGTVLLYDREGTIQFRGGITPARGHSGDNPGSAALIALLLGQRAEVSETPVFGCPLFDPGSDADGE